MGYRFRNRGSDCFANVAVNSILCLESLMQELQGSPNKTDIVKYLVKAYEENREDGRAPIDNIHLLRDKMYPTEDRDAASKQKRVMSKKKNNGGTITNQDDPDDMVFGMIDAMNIQNSNGQNIEVRISGKKT